MIRLLVILLMIAALVYFVLSIPRRLKEGQRTVVAVTGRNVSVRGRRLNASMEWRDVRRIDVARAPTIGVEDFCVVLFGNNDESLAVYDVYDGFQTFEAKMFNLWPRIREEWARVFMGSPNISERVTVWKKDGG